MLWFVYPKRDTLTRFLDYCEGVTMICEGSVIYLKKKNCNAQFLKRFLY